MRVNNFINAKGALIKTTEHIYKNAKHINSLLMALLMFLPKRKLMYINDTIDVCTFTSVN